jgi:hypothetical protein
MILSVVMYGCETLSLTLRKKGRLRVFENRVLRRIFGPKRDEDFFVVVLSSSKPPLGHDYFNPNNSAIYHSSVILPLDAM